MYAYFQQDTIDDFMSLTDDHPVLAMFSQNLDKENVPPSSPPQPIFTLPDSPNPSITPFPYPAPMFQSSPVILSQQLTPLKPIQDEVTSMSSSF